MAYHRGGRKSVHAGGPQTRMLSGRKKRKKGRHGENARGTGYSSYDRSNGVRSPQKKEEGLKRPSPRGAQHHRSHFIKRGK